MKFGGNTGEENMIRNTPKTHLLR